MDADVVKGPCPVCDGAVSIAGGVVSEIVSCPDCGSELEIRALDPLELAEAPVEEEDWGE